MRRLSSREVWHRENPAEVASDWASVQEKLGSTSRSALMSCQLFASPGKSERRVWRGLGMAEPGVVLRVSNPASSAELVLEVDGYRPIVLLTFLATSRFPDA